MTRTKSILAVAAIAFLTACLAFSFQATPAYAATQIDSSEAKGLSTGKGSSSDEVAVGNFVISTDAFPTGAEYSVDGSVRSWSMYIDRCEIFVVVPGMTTLDSSLDDYPDSMLKLLVSAAAEEMFDSLGVKETSSGAVVGRNDNGVGIAMTVGTSSNVDLFYIMFFKGKDVLIVTIADNGSSRAFDVTKDFVLEFIDDVSYKSSR